MKTIYGGITLNGFEVNDMVDHNDNRVVFKEDTQFFARETGIGDIRKGEPLKPGVALFYNGNGLEFTPLLALEAQSYDQDNSRLIDTLFGLGEIATSIIGGYSGKELKELVELTNKLRDLNIQFIENEYDATDSSGQTIEGMVEYEGEKYYVYSSAYSGLSFEAECARDILQARKKALQAKKQKGDRMTVANLKRILAAHNDTEEVLYFDSEAGNDVPMNPNWISFEENGGI